MASEPDASLPPLFEQLIAMSLASFSLARPDSVPNHGSEDPDHESLNRIILIGATGFDSLMNDDVTKSGQPPASQASIDGLPSTEVKCTDEIESLGGECVICMEEWRIGDVVSEMPCKHRFHGGCVEKWLKIHGSCPVCRYKMPVDDDSDKKTRDEIEIESGRRRGGVWVTFAVGSGGLRGETESLNEDSSMDASMEASMES